MLYDEIQTKFFEQVRIFITSIARQGISNVSMSVSDHILIYEYRIRIMVDTVTILYTSVIYIRLQKYCVCPTKAEILYLYLYNRFWDKGETFFANYLAIEFLYPAIRNLYYSTQMRTYTISVLRSRRIRESYS